MTDTPKPATPELDRLAQVQAEFDAVVAFIESTSYSIAEWVPVFTHGEIQSRDKRLQVTHKSAQDIAYEYFGLNPAAIDLERLNLLMWATNQST